VAGLPDVTASARGILSHPQKTIFKVEEGPQSRAITNAPKTLARKDLKAAADSVKKESGLWGAEMGEG
jgi:hypothetical protein